MILKTLTKEQLKIVHDEKTNAVWGLDTLIYDAQMQRENEIVFNPPLIVPKEVTAVFKSNPYNFDIIETNEPNGKVRLTKISWI